MLKIASVMKPMNFRKNGNRASAQITPNRLKTVWASAARFADVLPTDAAIFAVIVVPMFSPSTIAQAMSKRIHPMLSMIRVSAMVALED